MKFRCFFTFIELSVVLVIIGILSALVGPRILSGISGRGVESAARRLSVVAEHAGSLAATTGNMHVLAIDLREGVFYIVPAGQGEEDANSTQPYEGRRHTLPDGVRFTSAELEGEAVNDMLRVRFAPDGWADNAVVWLEDERGGRLKVAFTRSRGKVEVTGGGDVVH